jgi:hypothetical protein
VQQAHFGVDEGKIDLPVCGPLFREALRLEALEDDLWKRILSTKATTLAGAIAQIELFEEADPYIATSGSSSKGCATSSAPPPSKIPNSRLTAGCTAISRFPELLWGPGVACKGDCPKPCRVCQTGLQRRLKVEHLVTMTPAEWARISGNPRQRNTEDRVKRAKHLFTPSKDQQAVKMAVLPDGGQFKIDGHTRGLFWQLHPEIAPPELWVLVYSASDMAEVAELYDHCDNQAALETSNDKVFGAFRELGFEPVSGLMRMGRLAAALRLAYAVETHQQAIAVDVHRLVEHWLPEIRILDELVLQPSYFNVPVMAAALLTLRRYKAAELNSHERPGHSNSGAGRPWVKHELVREFWDRYNRNDGRKEGLAVDAVEALRKLIAEHRMSHSQKSTVHFLAARAIACVERYLARKTYKLGTGAGVNVRGTELSTYFPPASKPPGGVGSIGELRKRETVEEVASLL